MVWISKYSSTEFSVSQNIELVNFERSKSKWICTCGFSMIHSEKQSKWKQCPVNVHWNLKCVNLSVGQMKVEFKKLR